eukprot:scaffold502958_cov46-Prasinocladus_malaysianus.AAC.1
MEKVAGKLHVNYHEKKWVFVYHFALESEGQHNEACRAASKEHPPCSSNNTYPNLPSHPLTPGLCIYMGIAHSQFATLSM